MSSFITRSVSSASAMLTRSMRRVLGLSVVSQSTAGIISPRPLKRVISVLALPLALSLRMRARSASSAAQ
jgi:hypothetical protein